MQRFQFLIAVSKVDAYAMAIGTKMRPDANLYYLYTGKQKTGRKERKYMRAKWM